MNNIELKMLGEELAGVAKADNVASASALFAPKYEQTRISGFSKSKGVRKFRFGTDEVLVNDMDWLSITAVIAGKLPKATIDREWSVSCDKNAVVFRSNRNGRSASIESKILLQKLG